MASKMAYAWKTGFFKTDANVAGAVFEELESTVGLTSKTLVNASRKEDAPLHGEFEWNDAIAGEKWRERQATTMIQNITVVIDEERQRNPVRAFVTVDPVENTYEHILTVISDKDKKALLMAKALAELNSFRRKYSDLEALSGVFMEIEKLKEVS